MHDGNGAKAPCKIFGITDLIGVLRFSVMQRTGK
jgi:hypothetical protein